MSADEIGMQVRLDDIIVLNPMRGGVDYVLVDVALRIDDRSHSLGPDQIRSVCQASQIELLKVHASSFILPFELRMEGIFGWYWLSNYLYIVSNYDFIWIRRS